MVFVDTSAWFAFFVPSDPNHSLVRDWFEHSAQPLLTTDFCVDETLTLLLLRRERRRAVEAGSAFFHGGICTLHYIVPDEIHLAWLLFQQRAPAGWSFTDCTSKVVIDKLRVESALTLDEHFAQFGNVIIVP